MKIRYWEGKMKYAKMRIEVNKKKLDQLNKNRVKSNKLLLSGACLSGLNVIKYYSTGTGSGTPRKNFK